MSNVTIAIVGASVLTSAEIYAARALIRKIMSTWHKDTVLVSGGAEGIDSIAESIAISLGIKCEIFRPTINAWQRGLTGAQGGYQERNLKIAQAANHIICIAAPSTDSVECVHCYKADKPAKHRKSGGCWTAHQKRHSSVLVLTPIPA